jgi:hypothetical protein
MPAPTPAAQALLLEPVLDSEANAARMFIERFEYTTTALAAFELGLRAIGDEVGAELVHSFKQIFAEHESEQL